MHPMARATFRGSFAVSLLCLLALFAQAAEVKKVLVATATQGEVGATLYVPEAGAPKEGFPLLVAELPEELALYAAEQGYAVAEIHDLVQRLRAGYLPDEDLRTFYRGVVRAAKEEVPINEKAIGAIGGSGGGITTFRLGSLEKLAACVPMAAPHNAEEIFFLNGTARLSNGLAVLPIVTFVGGGLPPDIKERSQRTARDLALSTVSGKKKAGLKEFFRQFSPSEYVKASPCPSLIINSWGDVFMAFDHAWANFAALKAPRKLVMSEGAHGSERRPEELAFQFSKAFLWLDHYLKGAKNGVEKEPPIVLSLPGSRHPFRENEMEHFYLRTLPDEASQVRYFLHDGRIMNGTPPAGDEEDFLVENGMQESFLEDDAVQSLVRLLPNWLLPNSISGAGGGRDLAQMMPFVEGFLRQVTGLIRPVRIGTFYDGPELVEDLLLVGPAKAKLFVQPQESRFQLHLKLYDVASKGRAQLVSRVPFSAEKVEPGRVMELNLTLRSAFHRFPKGHRLRLTVTSTDFPSALPLFDDFAFTVHHGQEQPSLVLPRLTGDLAPPPPPTGVRVQTSGKERFLVWDKPKSQVAGFLVYGARAEIEPSVGTAGEKRVDETLLGRMKLVFAGGLAQIGYVPFPQTRFPLPPNADGGPLAVSALSLFGIESNLTTQP